MLPLEGLRVIAVEQYGAGPFGTQLLADLGADLIKVENPRDGGDMARSVGPAFLDPATDSDASLFFQTFNRNKRSLTLDLGAEAGRTVLHDLVRTADALACNLRGDVPSRLGLTYETLGSVNPKIVCAHLTAYGREGPRAAWPGYDFLVQAEAGYFALTGDPHGPPSRFGLSVVDMMTGIYLAAGLLAGIVDARQTGRGRDIDVSLFDVGLHNLSYIAAWYLATGHNQGRTARSAHPSLTPCQLYRTRDGWIYLMCNKEKFWGTLCRHIGRPELADDPRFVSFETRLAHRDTITEILDEVLSGHTTAEWLERFAGAVPAAPVLDVVQALENPFVTQSDRIQTLTSRNGQPLRLVASPLRCPGEQPADRAAPQLGEDVETILGELGYDAERIATLRRQGIV